MQPACKNPCRPGGLRDQSTQSKWSSETSSSQINDIPILCFVPKSPSPHLETCNVVAKSTENHSACGPEVASRQSRTAWPSPSTHPSAPPTCLHRSAARLEEGSKAWSHVIICRVNFSPSIFFHGVCLAMPAFCDRKNSLIVLGSASDRFFNPLLCLALFFWIHSHSTWDLRQFRSWRVFRCIWRSLLPSIGADQSCDRHLTEFSCETLPLYLLFSVQTGNSLLIFTKSKRQSFCCAYCPRRALCGHRVQDTFYCWKASALVVWLISTVLTTTLWVGAQDTAREIPPHSAQMLWDCAYQTLSKQRAVRVVHGPWTTVISLHRVNIKSIPNAFLLLVRALDWLDDENEWNRGDTFSLRVSYWPPP